MENSSEILYEQELKINPFQYIIYFILFVYFLTFLSKGHFSLSDNFADSFFYLCFIVVFLIWFLEDLLQDIKIYRLDKMYLTKNYLYFKNGYKVKLENLRFKRNRNSLTTWFMFYEKKKFLFYTHHSAFNKKIIHLLKNYMKSPKMIKN